MSQKTKQKVTTQVTTVITGWHKLVGLDKANETHRESATVTDAQGKVLFQGYATSHETLDMKAKLAQIVDVMTGATFLYEPPVLEEVEVAVSDVKVDNFSPAFVDERLGEFTGKVDAQTQAANKQGSDAKTEAQQHAEALKASLTGMSAALASGDLQQVKDALTTLDQTAGFGIRVDTRAFNKVLNGMRKLARAAKRFGYSGADNVLVYLNQGAAASPGVGTTDLWNFVGVYEGDLDMHLIAQDLWRVNKPTPTDEAAAE